jgi:branched-subunit amino acid aminotransferase/4-amino-4-deoxychorismate lyase
MIPEDDRGLLLGDGLFETILAEDGRLHLLDAHIDRMIRGCAVIGLAPPDAAEARRAAEQAAAGISGRAAVRLTLTAGSGRGLDRPEGSHPRLLASASSAPEPSGPSRLCTVGVRRNDNSPASRIKSLSYLDNVLARREARARGADEALMLNSRGEIAGAAAANLFWIEQGRLFTPALACGVLDGIIRGQVLAAAGTLGVEAAEVQAPADRLESAEGAFLTSSLVGLLPVAEVDGRSLDVHRLALALSSRCR